MFSIETKSKVDRVFSRLQRKNPKQLLIIYKKVEQIVKDPYHFKPLRGDMHGARRVHIDKSFVLVYEIDSKKNVITLLDYDHHDNIY
jgi:YafQ family addiction module toxin component